LHSEGAAQKVEVIHLRHLRRGRGERKGEEEMREKIGTNDSKTKNEVEGVRCLRMARMMANKKLNKKMISERRRSTE